MYQKATARQLATGRNNMPRCPGTKTHVFTKPQNTRLLTHNPCTITHKILTAVYSHPHTHLRRLASSTSHQLLNLHRLCERVTTLRSTHSKSLATTNTALTGTHMTALEPYWQALFTGKTQATQISTGRVHRDHHQPGRTALDSPHHGDTSG